MDRSSSWTSRNSDYVPPSRVARMAVSSTRQSSSTPEAVVTSRRAEYGSGGSILPVLPTASPNASKRTSWTTPRSPGDTLEDEVNQSSETCAPPPRRAEMAAARRTEPIHQCIISDGLFAPNTEQAQLSYMEQMYGTINLLNAELESERRNRAALEAAAAGRPSTYSAMSDYSSFEEDAHILVGEFDQPKGLVVSQTPVAPSYSPRKLRTMPSPPSHPPPSQHRVARPPVSPRSIVKDEELCATLGKNAELRIRSRDMERTVEKTELELELARKQVKMAERRAENREEKLRALLKEKLNWQKELKATRAQVVEEKMRQVDLFREVEAAKRHFATELEAVEQELRAAQEENAQLRAHGAEVKAHMNFQTRKMEEMARQAQDEKARFVAMIEDTRHRFREWKEGEAEALVAAHDQDVRNLKTEYELKMERHQDEKQKLREKVNDLEVSMRLLQKDRTLSPLELSLRKAAILGSKDNTGTMEAGQIEAQSRILELEKLLAHSQQYQLRQESIIKLSEATISRLMQEREVTALENLSLHPFGVEPQLPRTEDLSSETQLAGYVTAPSSPVRYSSPPGTPSRRSRNTIKTNEPPSARSPRSRTHTPTRAELEARIAEAAESDSSAHAANTGNTLPSSREQSLMDELAELRKALAEAQTKTEAQPVPPKIKDIKSAGEEPVEMPKVLGAAITSSSDEIAFDNVVAGIESTETKAIEPPNPCCDNVVESNLETNTHNEATTTRCEVNETPEAEDEKQHEESTNDATSSDFIDKTPCKLLPSPETAPYQDTFVNNETEGIDTADTETKDLAETMTHDGIKESNSTATLTDGDNVQNKSETEAVDSQCKAISDNSKDYPNESNIESGLSDTEITSAYIEDKHFLELDNEAHTDPDEKEVAHNVSSEAKLSEDLQPNMQESNDASTDEKEVDDAKASEDVDLKFHKSDPDDKVEASKVVCNAKLLEGFDSTCQKNKKEIDNNESIVPSDEHEDCAKDTTDLLDKPLEVPNADQEISPDTTEVDENANEALDLGVINDRRMEAVAEDSIQRISCEMIEISDDVREDNSSIDATADTNDVIAPIEESAEVLAEPPQIGVPDNLASPAEEINYGQVDVSDVPFEVDEPLTTEPSGDFAEQPNDTEYPQPPSHDRDQNTGSEIPAEAPIALADSLITSADDTLTAENADHEVEVARVLEETEALELSPNDIVASEDETNIIPVETPGTTVETGMEELSPVGAVEDNTFSTTKMIETSAGRGTIVFSGVNALTDAETAATSVPVSSEIENAVVVAVDALPPANIDTHEMNTPEEQHASRDKKFEQELATETPTTSLDDVKETDEDVVRLATKTFATIFVKELMELPYSTTSNENVIETNEEVVTHVTKAFAENFVKELLEMVEYSTALEDPVKTSKDAVALVAKTVAENFVKELIEMISSKALMIEYEEADEARAGESIATAPCGDLTAASTEEFPLLSEKEAYSSMATSVDTMALARDFMDTVESEAMSAVLNSLQNESCLDDTKAGSELENEGFESDTTRSIMGSDNASSEEQNEICNDGEGLMSENEEQRSMVELSSTQNEARLAELHDNARSIDQLRDTIIVAEIAQIIHDCVESVESEEVDVVQSIDIEKPTTAELNAFSTQEIISGVACIFASQTIAEVLNRFTQTCDQGDNSDYGEVAESENVSISMRDDTSTNEKPAMMSEVVDTGLLEEHNEGTMIFLKSEVIEPATVDIQSKEALLTADSQLVVDPDANAEDSPSLNVDIMQDDANFSNIGSENDGKVVALLLAETVNQIECGETPGINMEVKRIATEENTGDADHSGGSNTADEVQSSEESQTTSDSLVGETQDEIPYTDDNALPDDISRATPVDNTLDAETVPPTPDCDVVKTAVGTLIDDITIDSVMDDIIAAIESENRVEQLGEEVMESSTTFSSNTLLGSNTEASLVEEVGHESIEAKGTEVPTLSSEASQFLDTTDSKSEDTYKHGDIEPYTASSFALHLEDNEYVVRLTLDNLVDVVAKNTRSCSVLTKETATDSSNTVSSPDEYDGSPEPMFESEMVNVVTDLCASMRRSNAPSHRGRAQSVHFSIDTREDNIDHLKQARRSVLLWKSPIGKACNKEAVESSAKRRASRRRVSRRTFADLLAFPAEMTRFTSSDTTLLAYDARHEQGQICSLLDESILTINPNGRHIDMDDQDERVASRIIGKRKTLMQELHSKNIALRQIPRFNYMPMCIKFQWSDFVVATSVRPSNCNIGEGHVVKCPVEPMRLLRKKGAKLPCGSYVIVSAFIRPLEDGNENLRVQIYDAERVEEFQFDFSEDIMKKYHLETTGMESQSLEFLEHLEFRRDEDTIIIKLPEKKAEAGNNSNAERLQSERTMIGGGDPRKRDPPPYRQKRPVSSPPMASFQDDSDSVN